MVTEAPWLPSARAGKRKAHGQRLVRAAGHPHLSLEPQRLSPRHWNAELDLTLHLPAIEIAQPRLDLEPAVATLEVRLDPHPVDRDRPGVLELDRAPQPDRDLPLVPVGQAPERGRGIRPEVSVVEQTHDVALLVRLALDRCFAADHEQVLGLEVRRQVETEWREVSVMRPQQLPVQPDVGGEECAAEAKHDATGVVWARKLGPIPHGLATFSRQQLTRHLDRLPAGAATDRQALRFPFAERHPHGLPPAQLTRAARALGHGQEQAIAHLGAT